MKNKLYIFLIFIIILMTSLTAYAFNWKFWEKREVNAAEMSVAKTVDFEILPTMDSVSNAKNQVWVGTFQLIWNDLVNELIKQPVEFVGYDSVIAKNLNKQDFTIDDISESAYYKKWGLVSPKLKSEIETGIKEKFNETSDILDEFDWTPEPGKYFLYAMLKKDFEFYDRFDKLADAEFKGSDGLVKYFGIDKKSSEDLREIINVLYYNSQNDYAVALRTKQNDTVYLYRTDDDKLFDDMYADMMTKTKSYKGERSFSKRDEFKVPYIEFKLEREFPEICNKPIKNTSFMITKALETVQFKMDETGVKLKSEAGMMLEKCIIMSRVEDTPRYFYFDNKFVIFLQEGGKTKPYFAMKIEDVKKLQK